MENNNPNIQQNSPAQGQASAGSPIQADSQLINDSMAGTGTDNLMEGTAGTELNPEYGDAADPTSEKTGTGGRDDASPLQT